jgi:UDP-GlcNAc:undecaprenyl-phosphate GlcNAc-1-phosphate transferase
MDSLFLSGLTAFLLSITFTPLVRLFAQRIGAVDMPDGSRKIHGAPVPRIGGCAIALACAGAMALTAVSPFHAASPLQYPLPLALRLLPAAIVVFLTGLIDDLFGMKPWHKLAMEALAGALAIAFGGLNIDSIASLHIPTWLGAPLILGWLLLCMNAVNLIDGMDGLATGVSLFAACTTLGSALLQGNVGLAVVIAPLVGALLGFLRYNFNPATIFLGDCGSLLIGFLLGCSAIIWSNKSATLLGILAPIIALSIPLLDTTLTVVRRFLRKRPIFGPDRGHIHHRLLDQGLTPRRAVLCLYGFCMLAALSSIAVTNQNHAEIAIAVFCGMTIVCVQRLRYAEFRALRHLLSRGGLRRQLNAYLTLQSFETRLQAAVTPGDCWTVIEEVSETFGYHDVKMSLAGQTFQYRNGRAPAGSWQIRVPISGADYVTLTRECNRPGAVGSYADVLKRTLAAKLPVFAAVDSTYSNQELTCTENHYVCAACPTGLQTGHSHLESYV